MTTLCTICFRLFEQKMELVFIITFISIYLTWNISLPITIIKYNLIEWEKMQRKIINNRKKFGRLFTTKHICFQCGINISQKALFIRIRNKYILWRLGHFAIFIRGDCVLVFFASRDPAGHYAETLYCSFELAAAAIIIGDLYLGAGEKTATMDTC